MCLSYLASTSQKAVLLRLWAIMTLGFTLSCNKEKLPIEMLVFYVLLWHTVGLAANMMQRMEMESSELQTDPTCVFSLKGGPPVFCL